MHPNAHIITRFYDCFQARNGAGMGACYAPGARFTDPVFQELDAARARAMWRMLCERAQDLQVELGTVAANDYAGHAHWEAWYTFSETGRSVHNRIEARFAFADGAIVDHQDSFDLWAWAGQALGWKGRLFGWSSSAQNAIRRQATAALDAYVANHPDR